MDYAYPLIFLHNLFYHLHTILFSMLYHHQQIYKYHALLTCYTMHPVLQQKQCLDFLDQSQFLKYVVWRLAPFFSRSCQRPYFYKRHLHDVSSHLLLRVRPYLHKQYWHRFLQQQLHLQNLF